MAFQELPALRRYLLRLRARTLVASPPSTCTKRHQDLSFRAQFSTVSTLQKNDPLKKNDYRAATTAGKPGQSGDHEGQFARTDGSVRVEYPEEEQFPKSTPVQGRGGLHFKRTLASFSLEGRTAVVTGGARGLGLVMAQALTTSGADVAIVDLNSEFGIEGVGSPPNTRRRGRSREIRTAAYQGVQR